MTLYYTPPKLKIFNEMKSLAINLWETYDNRFWYADEKINSIKDIDNIWDNFMYIYAMFDCNNQQIIRDKATDELITELDKRLI